MHEHILSFFHGSDGDGRVKMVRRHDLHRIHILFLIQQLSEVSICSATLEALLSSLVRIIRLHPIPSDFPAATNALYAFTPRGLVQNLADAVANLILRPVHLIGALFVGITYGDDLHRWIWQQTHHLPQSLCADANVSQGDLIVRSDVPG